MSKLRLFRNDGHEMFAEDPTTLDYIEPGTVLLYADTGKGLLCSFLKAKMGEPIQATVERQSDDGIDPASLREAVTERWGDRITLSDASPNDPSDTQWALDGLSEEPMEVPKAHIESIRDLLTRTTDDLELNFDHDWIERVKHTVGLADDPQTERIDIAVRNPQDGAQLFRAFIEQLEDIEFTVALSKSGRSEKLTGTDIVIHVESEALEGDEQIIGLNGTTELISARNVAAGRNQIRNAVAPYLAEVEMALLDAINNHGVTRYDAGRILREELNETLLSRTSFRVVDSQRERGVKFVLAVTGLLTGLITGVLVADWMQAAADSLVAWAGRAETTLSRWLGILPDLPAIPAPAAPYVGLALISVVLLSLVTLVGRYRASHSRIDDNLAVQGIRADAVRLTLRLTAVISLLALAVSAVGIWTQL